MALTDSVRNQAEMNRLNTVEAAFAGDIGAANTYKASWVRFADNNGTKGVVMVNGKEYIGDVVGSTYIKEGQECYLRVGQNIKIIGW